MAGAKLGFDKFVRDAESTVLSSKTQLQQTTDKEPLLNGMPSQIFRQSINLNDRRKSGTFFSGAQIATHLTRMLASSVPRTSVVMDPTCGMGDLLLAYAQILPIESDLERTLELWGKVLMGIEQQSELVRLSKLRIAILARYRGNFTDELSDIDRFFPQIIVGNMFENEKAIRTADAFLFNPPFGQTVHPHAGDWSSGSVNAAAVFLDFLIQEKKHNAPIAAILPEVLRCGTRYERFRTHIRRLGIGGAYSSLGRFDRWADVDVFATHLSPSDSAEVWRATSASANSHSVSDFFNVRVGPVVPHRHDKKGPWRRYICAKSTPAWSKGYEPETNRRFNGTVFAPPFVVVRRTSSPSDRNRAVGSVVVGSRSVAVENHLLVLVPKNGAISTCHTLVDVLHRPETTDHLNETIRCRHLTTGSVADIPWTIGNV